MDSQLYDMLFIDIETAAQKPDFEQLPDRLKPLWQKKALQLRNEEELSPEALYTERAAIYAEFGQVICIGLGFIYAKNGVPNLRIKTLHGTHERDVLNQFLEILAAHKAKDRLLLCAHNGKEFDFPYLCRRLLINGLALPPVLNLSGKKPWQIQHIDTMEMWKFGDYKSYTSLDLLAAIFDIPSSKSDIDGSAVSHVFHAEKNLQKIAEYCAKDVLVLTQLYLRLHAMPCIPSEHIEMQTF
ncbi:3'-5' exonuclease [Marinilongibacter aquaticus]|uniref:3'-5' exonuclease n=1 Tax=Marinilongibacter aquaticus TaxID=2975157 RepID=UPI0021BDD03C|nr:3'-5' exonuclease [Marinilongibacter aquaticus]UBM57696.1 3'-5' exonuclease [Marinilongibacter aquaticus]